MKLVRILIAMAVASIGVIATAQVAPSGTYFAQALGLQFSFAPQPSGEIVGALIGGGGETPINYVGDGVAYHGHFTVENMMFGVTVQLADSGVLNIWLYEFDNTGTPVQSSYEWYEAQLVQQAPAAGTPTPFPTQTRASDNSAALVGMWQAQYVSGGSVPVTGVVYFDQNGTYEYGMYDSYGQLMYASAGTWSLNGNQLMQYVTDYTPQMCLYGSCQPFQMSDADRSMQGTLSFQPGSMTLVDSKTGQTLTYYSGDNQGAPNQLITPNPNPLFNYQPPGGNYYAPPYGYAPPVVGGYGGGYDPLYGGTDFGGGYAGGGLSPLNDNDHAKWINTVIYENYELDDYY